MFTEKANVTEMYLNLKQELIDKNSQISELKMKDPSVVEVSGGPQHQSVADLGYQLKQREQSIKELQDNIAELKYSKSQELTDLKSKSEKDQVQLKDMHGQMQQAIVKLEAQKQQIVALRLEQRVMAGVLHKVGAEYCFDTAGTYTYLPN